jgi:flavin reductase (DIM6/NTAB) family NADH-FMN oxidoreductase RutF
MQPTPQSDTPAATEPAAPVIAAALGRIPSGLFVVGWRDGDADRAMLASWVMQAGFAPPLVSVAVAPSRDLLAAIDRGASFAVSVLGDSQRSLLARFGKPADDPFAGLPIDRTPGGLAALAEAAAWLECRPAAQARHGDHVVVLAEVVAAGGTGAEPVVHVRKNGLRY